MPGAKPKQSPGRSWLRSRWVTFLLATILVVVLALLIRAVASNQEPLDTWGHEPLLAAVTGITPERLQSPQEEWEQILPRVEQLVSKSPDDVNLQRKLALAYYNLGRLAEAKTIYEQLLAKQEDPVLRNRLGNTLRDMGDIAGAEAAYRKAMADNPALGSPYVNLAELLWRQDRAEQALQIIDKGLTQVQEKDRPALEKAREFLRQLK